MHVNKMTLRMVFQFSRKKSKNISDLLLKLKHDFGSLVISIEILLLQLFYLKDRSIQYFAYDATNHPS